MPPPHHPNTYLHAPRPIPALPQGHMPSASFLPPPGHSTSGGGPQTMQADYSRRHLGLQRRLDRYLTGSLYRTPTYVSGQSVPPARPRRRRDRTDPDYCSHPAYHESNIPEMGLGPSLSRRGRVGRGERHMTTRGGPSWSSHLSNPFTGFSQQQMGGGGAQMHPSDSMQRSGQRSRRSQSPHRQQEHEHRQRRW